MGRLTTILALVYVASIIIGWNCATSSTNPDQSVQAKEPASETAEPANSAPLNQIKTRRARDILIVTGGAGMRQGITCRRPLRDCYTNCPGQRCACDYVDDSIGVCSNP